MSISNTEGYDTVDSEPGMSLGDWEDLDQGFQQRADAIVVNEALPHYSPDSYDLPENTRCYQSPGMPQNVPGHRLPPGFLEQTPALHARPSDMVQPRPSQRVQSGPSQEVQPRLRNTQPLNPQMVRPIKNEREQSSGLRYLRRRQQKPQLFDLPIPEETLPIVAPLHQRMLCPRCKGAGFLRTNVPFGHPDFGKPIPCECKELEKREKRRQQLREMSNLYAFHDYRFDNFNPYIHNVREAFDAAYEYANRLEGWLALIGPNGCGKTHLAASIAHYCLEQGAVVLFSVVPDLLDHLRSAFAPNATEVYDQLFAKMREAELLVLDDLGAQQSSPWANEKLFQLLNHRYNIGMPTVVTANTRSFQGLDERIRSRLTDLGLVRTINLEGMLDYRPRKSRYH